jgi:hypothetical protein
MVKLFCFILALTLLSSCTGVQPAQLKTHGESATINMKNGDRMDAELLALRDSTLIIMDDGVQTIPLNNIGSLNLAGIDRADGWVVPFIIFNGIPALFLFAASPIFSIPYAVLTGFELWSFIASTPQKNYSWPLSKESTENLRLYTRFPYGVTQEQLDMLQKNRK